MRSGICANPCHYSQFHAASPCNTKNASLLNPCMPKNPPCSLDREISLQHIEIILKFGKRRSALPAISKNLPANRQIAGRWGRETVSLLTASSATQSVSDASHMESLPTGRGSPPDFGSGSGGRAQAGAAAGPSRTREDNRPSPRCCSSRNAASSRRPHPSASTWTNQLERELTCF
jgi:hypothetical protein